MEKFNWHSEKLSPATIINETYKNTQNVRRFFKDKIGDHVHFTRDFMSYMKSAKGSTLGDAVKEWNKRYGK